MNSDILKRQSQPIYYQEQIASKRILSERRQDKKRRKKVSKSK